MLSNDKVTGYVYFEVAAIHFNIIRRWLPKRVLRRDDMLRRGSRRKKVLRKGIVTIKDCGIKFRHII